MQCAVFWGGLSGGALLVASVRCGLIEAGAVAKPFGGTKSAFTSLQSSLLCRLTQVG